MSLILYLTSALLVASSLSIQATGSTNVLSNLELKHDSLSMYSSSILRDETATSDYFIGIVPLGATFKNMPSDNNHNSFSDDSYTINVEFSGDYYGDHIDDSFELVTTLAISRPRSNPNHPSLAAYITDFNLQYTYEVESQYGRIMNNTYISDYFLFPCTLDNSVTLDVDFYYYNYAISYYCDSFTFFYVPTLFGDDMDIGYHLDNNDRINVTNYDIILIFFKISYMNKDSVDYLNGTFDDIENGSYDDGYNQGYGNGYSDGQRVGYDDGYRIGKSDGYTIGLTDGLTRGYNSGYDTGYSDGETSGYESGYETGYESGYDYGFEVGYDGGYLNGVASENDYTFVNLFGAIADVPIMIARNLLGFEVFGFSAWNILISMIAGVIGLFIFKKFIL